MNYRHLFHAGSFSDVVKHFSLTLLLTALNDKNTPFRVIDTHGGTGLYDLSHPWAQKTKEHESGIQRIMTQASIHPLFAPYLEVIRRLNSNQSSVTVYPGSPWLIKQFLKPHDSLQVSELHPEDYASLQQVFQGDKQTQVFHQNGFVSLRAFLPPVERRGLILIDPPYEDKNEFEKVVQGVRDGYRRFATGVYAVWFPIKELKSVQRFYKNLKSLKIPKMLLIEFIRNKKYPANRLNGCGLILINPPWKVEAQLQEGLPLLLEYLGYASQGKIALQWLVDEKVPV
jgi:23S rRNA (adenine2030-N6)-methyltransferase